MAVFIENHPDVVALADEHATIRAELKALSSKLNRMSPRRLERELREAREAFGTVEADAALGAITEEEAEAKRTVLRARFEELRDLRELQQQAATLTPEKRKAVKATQDALREAREAALKPLVSELVDALEDVLSAAEAIDEAEAELYEAGAIRWNRRQGVTAGTGAIKATFLQNRIAELTDRFDL